MSTEILSLVLGQAEFSQVLKKHEGNEQCDKCSYKSHSIKIWMITLTEHIWELHFSFSFSSSATYVQARASFEEIDKGIFLEYMKASALNASFVITGQLINLPWPSRLN